jgi:PGF-pre-PGF domain-containing protein/uncharacterized repeat protein (TIGR01451 family)
MVTAIVDLLSGQPSSTSGSPSGDVYNFVDIWVKDSGATPVENITNATIGFKVAESRIQSSDINQSSVVLSRYSNGVWDPLPISLIGNDGTYLYFTANTPGFSSYAITGNKIVNPTNPALTMKKTASPMIYTDSGQTITYTYTVTNSGKVDINAPITVTDDKFDTITIPSPSSGILSPGSSIKGTATYITTEADVDAGSVSNLATATGLVSGNNVTSNNAVGVVLYEREHHQEHPTNENDFGPN